MKKSKYPKKSGLGAVFYQVFIRVSWVVGNVSVQHVEYLITFFISFHMSYITLIDYIDINLVSFLFFLPLANSRTLACSKKGKEAKNSIYK
jgi:hypothetical protein